MLTRPLTLNDSDDRGRGLVAVTLHPALPLADEGDDDDETQTGVFSPPAPPWSSSSSSSPSSPPPCASSSSSASSLTPPSFLSSTSVLTPPPAPPSPPLSSTSFSNLPVSLLSSPSSACPPPPVAPSLLSSASSTPPLTSSVLFTPCTPPHSLFSPLSSLTPRAPPCVSSTPCIVSPPPILAPSSHPPPPLPSSFSSTPPISTIPAPSSVSSPHPSNFFPLSSSSPCLHPSPPSLLSPHSVCIPPPSPLAPPSVSSSPVSPPPPPHDSPSFSSAPAPLPPLLYHHSSLISPPPPPIFFTPCTSHTSAICPPLSSSSPSVPPSLLSPPPPPSNSPTAPSLLPPAPPPCCPCSSLLPRLLSAHRLEVRRLLRGALASIGRRLDSLERRSRRKMRKKRSRQRGEKEGAACSSGSAVFSLSSSSSCSPAHIPPATSSSSSSDSEDSPTPPLSSSLSQSEQRRRRRSREEEEGERGRKRRRKNHRRRDMNIPPENREEDEEEEDAGRFVGRMAVSFRGGAEEEAPLTLHNFNCRKNRGRVGAGTGKSEKAVSVVRRNGFRAPLLLHSISSSSSQNSLHRLQSSHSGQTCSQSEALGLSSGQWHFSDFLPPINLTSDHSAFHLWLCSSSSSSSSSSFRPALMLRLSAVAMETISESMRGGACGNPLQPLKDWTAPPSLSSDHCYMRMPSPSPTFSARRQLKQRANHSSRSLHLPRRWPQPLPSCSANGLSALLPTSQSAVGSEFLNTKGERGKRVSQIRIRRAPPRETSLTPMGLPKVKRLKKKEFSLEEIYTNKNYKSPTTNRSLETIFEEPREKDGALLLIGHQRRRRLLLFPDFTQPRKRKRPQGAGLPVAVLPRKRAAARRCHGGGPVDDESDLDVMLVERLSALEDFLTRQGLDV